MSGIMMEATDPASDLSEEIRKKRIQFLKAVLNVYRGRALSLNSACESRMSNVTVPEHVKNYEFVREQVRGLHNDVALLRAFQDSVDVIHNNITYLGASSLNDAHVRRELQKIVKEVSFFSRSIMKLYQESINEIDNIRRKQGYSTALIHYQTNLNFLKEQQNQSSQSAEDLKRLQRAEIQVYKINFIREMKLILIGKFAGNSEVFPNLQNFRTPFRKNLTVDDFIESWDVGL